MWSYERNLTQEMALHLYTVHLWGVSFLQSKLCESGIAYVHKLTIVSHDDFLWDWPRDGEAG